MKRIRQQWETRVWHGVGRCALIMVIGLSTAGCVQTTPTAGVNLGKAGQAAAMQAGQAATLSSDSFAGFRRAEIFRQAYEPTSDTAVANQILDLLTGIQSELSARARVLQGLASAYGAFGNLAAYGASTEFTLALGRLAGAVDHYRTTLKLHIVDVQTATPEANLFVGLLQNAKIIAGSQALKVQLQDVIAAMSDPNTRTQFNTFKTIGLEDAVAVAQMLSAGGVLSWTPLLDQFGAPLGLKSRSDADRRVDNNLKVKRALLAVETAAATDQLALVGATYDKSLAMLKALLPLHDRLQAGGPLDLVQLDMAITDLTMTAAALKSQKGT